MCCFHHEEWTMQWIRQQYRPDHKQIVMPFSPIFDDAVLPQAFVSGLGRSCQARCYPRSPPKNLRPRAAAPQTLNRSIRHTMLRAAGVWAVAVGACLVPWPETWALSQTHIRSCTPHCKSTTLLLLTQLTYSFVSNVPLSYRWLLFLSVARWPIFLPLVPPAQLQICTVKIPTRPIYPYVVLQTLILRHRHHTSAGYIQTWKLIHS